MKAKSDNIILSAIVAIIVFLLSSCAIHVEKKNDGNTVEKAFNVEDFQSIRVRNDIDVVYSLSSTPSVMITAGENVMKDIRVETDEDGVLILSYKDEDHGKVFVLNSYTPDIKAVISGPALSAISLEGSGEFTCKDTMRTEKFNVYVAGSGEVKMSCIEAEHFSGSIAGSGDMKIGEAHVGKAEMGIAGSGEIDATLFDTYSTDVEIAGSGDVSIDFRNCNIARISIAGSGDVELKGTLFDLQQKISGSGDIRIQGLKTGVKYEGETPKEQ